MNILISGGAGYIGSHVVLEALDQGHSVTVFDNLSSGKIENISKNATFFNGSTLSKNDLRAVMKTSKYDAVVHLAASKAAGESMKNPSAYAENNIIGGINLINSCINNNIKIFIFSSTAAVYGNPNYIPIDEKHDLKPLNYYGFTKLLFEDNLVWFNQLKSMHFGVLRYFNAAGYDQKKRVPCLETSPQNLIPKIMEVLYGIRDNINIYGDSYPTKDGTGVRDYVHVSDLAKAHLDSILYIKKNKKNLTINLGTGEGYSVLEVIKKAEELSGKKVKYSFCEKRKGDPAIMISNAENAKVLIKWNPIFSDLHTILKSTISMYKA